LGFGESCKNKKEEEAAVGEEKERKKRTNEVPVYIYIYKALEAS